MIKIYEGEWINPEHIVRVVQGSLHTSNYAIYLSDGSSTHVSEEVAKKILDDSSD